MSLETATDQIRAQLPQLGALGYKVKFAIDHEGVILVDARQTPPTLSNDDDEADCTIRLSEDRLAQLIDGRLSPTLAYTLGQIKVEGSLGVAMKLASLLEDGGRPVADTPTAWPDRVEGSVGVAMKLASPAEGLTTRLAARTAGAAGGLNPRGRRPRAGGRCGR